MQGYRLVIDHINSDHWIINKLSNRTNDQGFDGASWKNRRIHIKLLRYHNQLSNTKGIGNSIHTTIMGSSSSAIIPTVHDVVYTIISIIKAL